MQSEASKSTQDAEKISLQVILKRDHDKDKADNIAFMTRHDHLNCSQLSLAAQDNARDTVHL